MKLFDEKKKRYRSLLLVLLPFVLVAGYFGYSLYNGAKELFGEGTAEEVEAGPKYSLPEYGYQLRADCTDIQFQYFQELIEAISNEDDELAAQCVAKSFIADFYTFSNKSGQYDIGGMNYIYSPQLPNVYTQARDQIYHYLNYFIDAYGAENLLEVENVEILGCRPLDENYEIDGLSCPGWFIRAQWTYVNKETDFISSDYETLQDVYVIKNPDSGRYEIVQLYGME